LFSISCICIEEGIDVPIIVYLQYKAKLYAVNMDIQVKEFLYVYYMIK